LTKNVILK
jgi:hypothetical protein